MAYDPFAAQSAALNKRSTQMDLSLGNPVSPGAAAAALSTPQEDPNEERADYFGTGTTNLGDQRWVTANRAARRDADLEQERAAAAAAAAKPVAPKQPRNALMGFGVS